MGIEFYTALVSIFVIGLIAGGMAVFFVRRIVINRQLRTAQRRAAKTVAEALLQQPNNSVEFIRLNDLTIGPCQACGGCSTTGECVIKDDMAALYEKTDSADRLFFVSPVYFYGVSGQMKLYTDRCQARWAGKYLLNRVPEKKNRPGYLISCAATKGADLFTGLILTIKCLCDSLDISWEEPLLIRNVEERSAVRNLPEELAACTSYGERIISTA